MKNSPVEALFSTDGDKPNKLLSLLFQFVTVLPLKGMLDVCPFWLDEKL